MNSTSIKTLITLKKTKAILQERGRTTGTLVDEETGCACLLGGIGLAVEGEIFADYRKYEGSRYDLFLSGEALEAVKAVFEALPEEATEGYVRPDYDAVYHFNDVVALRDATKAEADAKVIAVLDAAIKPLEDQLRAFVESEISELNLKSAETVLVSLGIAMAEGRALYGDYDDLPEGPLKTFLDRFFALLEEAGV